MRRAVLSAVVLLAGCSSLYNYEPETYVVQAGDTLYSIAFSHGLNYRELASWNRLADPSRLYVGQRLLLHAPGNAERTTARPATASTGTRRGSRGVSRPTTVPSASAASRTPTPTPTRTPTPKPPANPATPVWQWPVRGPTLSRFGEGTLTTGIGIGGQLGEDIHATAAGRVVYVGRLPDYGELIIIQHNETWLSAYGHNGRVLVKEGDDVTAGQTIAEMGAGPGGQPRLHFEIRRDGDALDPLTLLPASR